LIRHGETEWARDGRHTGRTDIPLTDLGRQQAKQLQKALSQVQFTKVLVSPLQRATETADLAGIGSISEVCDDLAEFDYGDYEGLTTAQINEKSPGWRFRTGDCPGGETMEAAARRAANVLAAVKDVSGNVALVSHGHMLRIVTVVQPLQPAGRKIG
jgi:probable phosphoglycerate mutase